MDDKIDKVCDNIYTIKFAWQASKHHGNTYKLVNAISEKYDIAMMDATKESIVDLQEYEVIGFTDSIKEIDLEKEAVILGEYGCKVHKTYGPWKVKLYYIQEISFVHFSLTNFT